MMMKYGEYGPGYDIDDPNGLHDVIDNHVGASPDRLRGQEVHFLLSMLDISQTSGNWHSRRAA